VYFTILVITRLGIHTLLKCASAIPSRSWSLPTAVQCAYSSRSKTEIAALQAPYLVARVFADSLSRCVVVRSVNDRIPNCTVAQNSTVHAGCSGPSIVSDGLLAFLERSFSTQISKNVRREVSEIACLRFRMYCNAQ